MVAPLLALWAVTVAAPAASPVIRHAEPDVPAVTPVSLASAEDVIRLCRALVPAERVRAGGDAIARGDAAARQRAARDEAFASRYRIVVPGEALRFAPFDADEGVLALDGRVPLSVAGGAGRVWFTEAPGLPVEVSPGEAKRILDAASRGTLALVVDFVLPEDATCGGGYAARSAVLAAEPVAWRFLDGGAIVAGGGADAALARMRPDARPRVEIGAPLQGEPAAQAAVAARRAELQRCYAEALGRAPGIDGVLVARLGTPVAIAADSVGDPELAECVRRAVSGVAGAGAVPIRFELVADATGSR